MSDSTELTSVSRPEKVELKGPVKHFALVCAIKHTVLQISPFVTSQRPLTD